MTRTNGKDEAVVLGVLNVLELARRLLGDNLLDFNTVALLKDVDVDGGTREETEDLDWTKLAVAARVEQGQQ